MPFFGKTRETKEAPAAKLPPEHPLYHVVQEAYAVFESDKPRDVDVCTEQCCMPKEVAADFFRPDIKDLPLDYLRDWFGAAYAPDGVRKIIWKYLLPRTLEVLSAGESPSFVGVEVVFSRFDTGNPDNWTHDQWRVLDKFQRAYLAAGFQSRSAWPGSYLDDIICMFAHGGWALDDLLGQIASMSDELVAHRLWWDWCEQNEGYGSIWTSTFWEKEEERRVREFYTSDLLRDRMAALAVSDTCDPEIAAKASNVFSVMDRCRC